MRLISEKASNKTYAELGAENLEKMMGRQRTSLYLDFLSKFLSQNEEILDLACGYGRLTIPLAKKGYKIQGVDLSPELIHEAKDRAAQENIDVRFEIGNMKALFYKDEVFDKIFCAWSSFNHILTKEEQIVAVNEMFRVLKKSGVCFIEMVDGDLEVIKNDLLINGLGEDKRIHPKKYYGVLMYDYIHNKDTLNLVCKESKCISFKVKKESVGGKIRLVAYLYK